MTFAMTSRAWMKNSSSVDSSINGYIRIWSKFIVIGHYSKNVYDTWNQECKAKFYQKTKERRPVVCEYTNIAYVGSKQDLELLNTFILIT